MHDSIRSMVEDPSLERESSRCPEKEQEMLCRLKSLCVQYDPYFEEAQLEHCPDFARKTHSDVVLV